MHKDIQIRQATRADLPELLNCEQEVIAWERPFDSTIKQGKTSYYDLVELMENSNALVLVAGIENTIVATGYALEKPARHYLDHDTYAYLGFMYTQPAYRGQGINGQIINKLKEWALSKGLMEVRLTVYDQNDPAIRAYEKVGFKKHIVEMRLRIGE